MPHSLMVHSSIDTTDFVAALFVVLALYLLPLVIALVRRHRHRGLICAVNLLLGWTIVGWLVSLIWSILPKRRKPVSAEAGIAEPMRMPSR